MADCINTNTLPLNSADPTAMPVSREGNTNKGTPETDTFSAAYEDWLRRLSEVAPSANEPQGAPLSSAVKTRTTTAAKLLTKATAGQTIERGLVNSIKSKLANATTRQASWFDRAATVIASWSHDNGKVFDLWAHSFFHQKGIAAEQQTLTQARNTMQSRAIGEKQLFMDNLHKAMLPHVEPIAKALNISPEEAARLVGEYATAVMAPHRNQHLLQKWREEAAELIELQRVYDIDPKSMTKEELKRYNEAFGGRGDDRLTLVETWRVNLERLINELYPENHFAPEQQKYWKSSGMTDAQALAVRERIMRQVGPDNIQHLDEAARAISKYGFDEVLNARARAGDVDPRQAAAFSYDYPEGVFVSMRADNQVYREAFNDATVFNPGNYYEADGMGFSKDGKLLTVQNAYDTAMQNIHRASQSMGSNELGRALFAAYNIAKARGIDIGLDVKPKGQLQTEGLLSAYAYQGAIAYNHIEDDGTISKYYIRFKPDWKDTRHNTNITGSDLNTALFVESKTPYGLQLVTRGTSLYGQMFTRGAPLFAPKNMFRDVQERGLYMTAMDLFTEAGRRVRGTDAAMQYASNLSRYGKTWTSYVMGKHPGSGPMAERIEKYIRWGLHSEFTRGMNEVRDTSLAHYASSQEGRTVMKAFEKLGSAGKKALATVDRWNDANNHIAPFTQFNTLLDMGVSERDAAAATLSMMNLYHTGKATPIMRAFYPFVKPTMQSATNISRALGLVYNPQTGRYGPPMGTVKSMAALMGAGTLLLPFIYESLGTDPETGTPLVETIPYSQMFGSIPIGNIDGSYVKLPVGFGLPSFALGFVDGVERIYSGRDSVSDVTGEFLFQFMKQMAPGNWPEFKFTDKPTEYLSQLLAPTLVAPVWTASQNTDRYGNPIRSRYEDPSMAASLQGRASTPQMFHDAARILGPDVSPDTLYYIAKGYTSSSALKLFQYAWGDSPRKKGAVESASDYLPGWLSAFGATQLIGRAPDVSQTMFYSRKNELDAKLRDSGVRIRSTEYGKDKDERIAYQTERLRDAGFSDKDITDYFIIEDTVNSLRKRSAQLNEKLPELRQASDSGPLQSAFDAYTDDAHAMYVNAWERMR